MTPLVEKKLKAFRAVKFVASLVDLHYPHLKDAPLAEIIERLSPCRHSPDYRSVKWFGTSYEFNATQAAIVAELWRAWENGTPRVGAGRLLSAMDCVSDKVSEIMKQNDAWGTMIKTDSRGNYWLQSPN